MWVNASLSGDEGARWDARFRLLGHSRAGDYARSPTSRELCPWQPGLYGPPLSRLPVIKGPMWGPAAFNQVPALKLNFSARAAGFASSILDVG